MFKRNSIKVCVQCSLNSLVLICIFERYHLRMCLTACQNCWDCQRDGKGRCVSVMGASFYDLAEWCCKDNKRTRIRAYKTGMQGMQHETITVKNTAPCNTAALWLAYSTRSWPRLAFSRSAKHWQMMLSTFINRRTAVTGIMCPGKKKVGGKKFEIRIDELWIKWFL